MICFIDFETSGVDVFKDYPIEFGALLVNENCQIVKKFHSYINPQRKRQISAQAFKIHGIDQNSLSEKPSGKEVLRAFFNSFGYDFRLAGWNISFDVGFLRKLAHQNSMMREFNKINHRHLDVQSMSFLFNKIQRNENDNVSLDEMCQYFKLQRSEQHNALEDAKLTFAVYSEILKCSKIQ